MSEAMSYMDTSIITTDQFWVIYCSKYNSCLAVNTNIGEWYADNRDGYKESFAFASFTNLDRNIYSEEYEGTLRVIIYPSKEYAENILNEIRDKLSNYYPEYTDLEVKRIRTRLYLV